ncbi:MAG: amidohydrolase [Gemmatimonadaceae bacterium]|nr:amidohydrolase [Gemmatimonadaceae bacterium]
MAVLPAAAPAQGRQPVPGQATRYESDIAAVMDSVVLWRRDIHEHPELGNREVRTSKLVADRLRALGIEVRANVAKTGVVGVLRGGKPGRTVALRADMDALPVTEQTDLPFKSKVTSTYGGQAVGVMHACGHDAHTAMLLGAATVLAKHRAELPGTVVFLFQPAEEGPPPGETGGAADMVKEGALDNPKVDAVFGLHTWPDTAGRISYRPRGAMSASDVLNIVVVGRQTHGAVPWRGVDPITVSSQIVNALQTIVSRQTDIGAGPAIVTVGTINGGVRHNIIPDSVVMTGTIRTFDATARTEIHASIRRMATQIAAASGATARVTIGMGTDMVYNDPALTAQMGPTIERVTGGHVNTNGAWTPSEDFSEYTKNIPGLFVFLGVNAPGVTVEQAAANHSPLYFVNEDALPTGVRALVSLATDYLAQAPAKRTP